MEQAVALRPSDPVLHVNLGILYRDLGRLREAVAEYGTAVALRNDQADAHFHRAEIKTFRVGDPDLAAMEALLARPSVSARDTIHLHFALGKARDDIGDYARAFAHWAEGNRRKRLEIQYDETATLGAMRLAAAFDRATIQRLRGYGHPTAQPIFVVGMPRSGSTLIEQILASHPHVHAAGEIGHLAAVVGTIPDPAKLDGATIQRLATEYLARLPTPPTGKTRLVDKAPTNFLRTGIIHLMFPHAHIVHSVRDPRDTGLSCFSKLFVSGCLYSYDLAELGRYGSSYLVLMDHWRARLPTVSLIDVRYEDLVADLPRRARALIESCGLPWDDACLRFHETRRSVRTASAAQVRRPIYATSVQRWRHYENELAPLLRELPR
jgi:hypothetical protein